MKRLIVGIAALAIGLGVAAPALVDPYHAKSDLAGVDMPLGATLDYQKSGLEVWSTLNTQQDTLNRFWDSGTVLPYCWGKFTSRV